MPKLLGPSLVYTSADGCEMDNIIEHCDEGHFAKGQSGRDLRVCPDAMALTAQLMDAIDSVGDFVRFVELSSRAAAINQRRLL